MVNQHADIYLTQGTDRRIFVKLTDAGGDLDLTGYTAAMQVKKTLKSEALDTLTTENGRLEIEGSGVRLIFTAEATAAYPATALYYDIDLISGDGLVATVLKGRIRVIAEVTK